MNKYECLYVIDSSLDSSVVENIKEKFVKLFEKNTEELKIDNLGVKNFSYEINKKKEGLYILTTFKCNTDFLKKIEHLMKLDENILKFLITKINEKKINKILNEFKKIKTEKNEKENKI